VADADAKAEALIMKTKWTDVQVVGDEAVAARMAFLAQVRVTYAGEQNGE
jgi:hypothetical protein